MRHTTLEPYKNEYQNVLDLTGLENDPFPIVAPNEVNYWADNKALLMRLKETLLDSLLFASSNIYIFWGQVGVGKTFAANYLCGPKGEELFKADLPDSLIKEHYAIKIRAAIPRRSGELLHSVYNGMVKKLINDIIMDDKLKNNLKDYHKNMEIGKLRTAFRSISNELRKTTLNSTSIYLENDDGYKFITDEKSKYGRLRDINDMGDVIISLISILLIKYEKISIIIDELEHLSRSTISERYQFNDLIKCIYEKVDVGLNIVFIYTFETYSEVETTLQPAVKDRIKNIIQFNLVNNESDIIEYIYECLEKRGRINPYDFMEENVIHNFASKLINNFKQISFRQINREMHKFIAMCFRIKVEEKELEKEKFIITQNLYQFYDKLI